MKFNTLNDLKIVLKYDIQFKSKQENFDDKSILYSRYNKKIDFEKIAQTVAYI